MIGVPSSKTKQFFFVLIKASIVIGAFYFIYQKLISNASLEFDDFYQFLIKIELFSLKNVIFLLFLTIFNWFLEIIKWQKLVNHCTSISLYTAFKQNLTSLTASLFTPNRIGDYAAKTLFYNKTYQKQILLLNLIANISQMSATVLFGCIGLSFFIAQFEVPISNTKLFHFVLIIVLVFLILSFGYKKRHFTIKGLNLNQALSYTQSIPKMLYSKTFGLSFIRYLTFSYQFFFLLLVFNVQLDYWSAMVVISSMYLLASIIPSFYIFDVVVKGSISVFVFGMAGVNAFTISAVVLIMWILNFMLPAIIGSFYVLGFKPYNNYKYDILK